MKRMGTFLVSVFILYSSLAVTGCGKGPEGAGGPMGSGGPGTEGLATEGSRTEAAGTEFGYPIGGEPWYFVRCALELAPVPEELASAAWSIDRVEVDGVRARDFLVYQGGREVDKLGIKAAGGKIALDVKARHVWRPGTSAEMKVQLVEPKSGDIRVLAASGTAPAGKGYWDAAWKNYMSLVVSEEHGFARTGYPVHATIGIIANYLRSPDEVRVVRAERDGEDVVYREIPSQVYDVVTWNDPKVLGVEEKDAETGEKVVR